MTKAEYENTKRIKQQSNSSIKNKKFPLFQVALLALIAYFLFSTFQSSEPNLPGTQLEDLGQNHIEPEASVTYNSNPPTSGSHYADWTKPGIYSEPQEDGYLLHSLEHGYVIISYNCNLLTASSFSLVPPAFAHDGEDHDEEATTSAETNESSSPVCQALISDLTTLTEDLNLWKLILVPNHNLDSPLALTAWTVIEKLDSFNETKIRDFVNAYRNNGPEKTTE